MLSNASRRDRAGEVEDGRQEDTRSRPAGHGGRYPGQR